MQMNFHAIFWPVFWILFWAGRSAIKHRRRMAELKLAASVPAALPATQVEASEIAELRDRVKVLERITVDERHSRDLADEIESLRDR